MNDFIYQIKINCVLGQLFKTYRTSKGLDQYEAANLIQINKASMSKLESGHINFNIEYIFALCEAYEIDLSTVVIDLKERIKTLEKNKVYVIKNSKLSKKLPELTRHQIDYFIN